MTFRFRMSFNSYQFMQRPVYERINSHWVRGCFGEDWEESFREKDVMKDSALIGVFDYGIVKHHPLRNEYEVRNEARLRREPLGRIIDAEEWERPVWEPEGPKYQVPRIESIDVQKVKEAVAKYATIAPVTPWEEHLNNLPECTDFLADYPKPKAKPKRRKKRLAPVTRGGKKGIDPYAPLADHLEEYIQKQVKEKKLPQPEVVTATKELIEQRVKEFKEQAKSMTEINDAQVWRLRMYDALEALLKTGRVHEFIN